jgi:hypothetical protein
MINGNACFAYFNKNWGIPAEAWSLKVLTASRVPSGHSASTSH